MERLSNRPLHGHKDAVIQFKYIKTPSEPEIQYIEVEKEVAKEVHSDPVIVHQEVDLSEIYERLEDHAEHAHKQDQHINSLQEQFHKVSSAAYNELEMQRRALVGLKAQRDIDRSRRLMLIKRMKKEHNEHKKQLKGLKLAIYATLILSIVSLALRH